MRLILDTHVWYMTVDEKLPTARRTPSRDALNEDVTAIYDDVGFARCYTVVITFDFVHAAPQVASE
jgi:hypothetical protein